MRDVVMAPVAGGGGVGRLGRWAGRGALGVTDQALFAGANFLLNVLLARWLAASEYGLFALVFSLFLFISGFHNALAIEPMLVFGSGRYRRRFGRYMRRLLVLHVQFSLAAAGVLGVGALGAYLFGSLALAATLGAFAVATPLILFLWLVRRACYTRLRPGLAASISGVYLLLQVVGLLALQRWGWLDAPRAVLSMGAASLVAAGLGTPAVMGGEKKRSAAARSAAIGASRGLATGVLWRRHWRYGKWVFGTAWVQWLGQNVFYVVLPATHGLAAVGELRALVNLTLPIRQFFLPLTTLLVPTLVRRRGSAGADRLQGRMVLIFGGAAAAFWAALWLLRRPTIDLLYDGRFMEVADVLLWLGAVPVIAVVGAVWRAGLKARERTDLVFSGFVGSAVITAIVGVPLTVVFGTAGAAWGLVLAAAAATAMNGWHTLGAAAGADAGGRSGAGGAAPSGAATGTGAASPGPIRVAWLVPEIPQYRLPFIRRLAQFSGLDVTCYHSASPHSTMTEGDLATLPLRQVLVPCVRWWRRRQMAWQGALRPIVRGNYQVVVCVEAMHHLTVWALWLLRRWGGYRFVLFGYGFRPQPPRGPVGAIVQRLRLRLLRSVDAVICYTDRGREAIIEQGVEATHVFVTRNTLDTEMLREIDAQVSEAALDTLRQELDLRRDVPVVVFVGRLLTVKRVDVLIDAMDLLRERGMACQLLVVGDGPERTALEARAAELTGSSDASVSVRFVGAVHDEAALARLMRLSSLLVIPGRVGLTCVHGFAHGLPVVTTDEHQLEQSPEYAYIESGINGLILEAPAPGVYADALASLLADPDRLARMREQAYESAERLSMSRMVEQFAAAVEFTHRPGSAASESRDAST